MNLKVYNAKERLRNTINAMSYVETKEELYKLFACAVQELLDYELILMNRIEK